MAALTFGPLSAPEVAGLFAVDDGVHENVLGALLGPQLFLPGVVALGKFAWTTRLAEMDEHRREALLEDMTAACDVAQKALRAPDPAFRIGTMGSGRLMATLLIGGGRVVMTPVTPSSWVVAAVPDDVDPAKSLSGFMPDELDDALVVVERIASGETVSNVWRNGQARQRTGESWSTPSVVPWSSFVDHLVAGSSW